MFRPAKTIQYMLWWLIAGTKGGGTRGRIILAIREMPRNANQLAEALGMDYKTTRQHLKVLEKNKIIMQVGSGYGITYLLSTEMEENYVEFEKIWEKVGKAKK
jgi:DNA-binding transcriptional ArsR family regulator